MSRRKPSFCSDSSITSVSSAKRTLFSSHTPSESADRISARFVRLFDPGGEKLTRKGLVIDITVRSLMRAKIKSLEGKPQTTRIVILGGGFAGAYCAQHLEKR